MASPSEFLTYRMLTLNSRRNEWRKENVSYLTVLLHSQKAGNSMKECSKVNQGRKEREEIRGTTGGQNWSSVFRT